MSAGTCTSAHSARSLAEWTLASEPPYRSPLVLRQARLLLLDTLGCATTGARAPTAQSVRALVDTLGGNPECTLIGARVWGGASSCGLVAAAMAGRLMRLTLEAHALSLAAIRCATPKVVRWGSLSSAKNIASSLIACAGVEGSRQ